MKNLAGKIGVKLIMLHYVSLWILIMGFLAKLLVSQIYANSEIEDLPKHRSV